MYKFQPILKSLIWGGDKIAPYKQIETSQQQVGESWELSGVKGNESVVAGGPEAGTPLPELIARHGAGLLGAKNFERFGEEFPLLIKFIDARQDLSIQVHPNDELAWERHQSKGKTEMWYVVAADKGAHLRSGFSKQVTPAEYAASVADNTRLRTSPTASTTSTAAMPTATPANCTPSWPRRPSTTPCCPTTGRTTPRRRTAAWSWFRAPISPRRCWT